MLIAVCRALYHVENGERSTAGARKAISPLMLVFIVDVLELVYRWAMITLFHYLLGHTRWHVSMLNGEPVMRRWTNGGWCYRGMTRREQAAHQERLAEQTEMQVW